jgi:hypothetical protein
MNIKLNDKAALQILRDRIDKALAPVRGEFSMKLKTGRISYEADGASAKITLNAEVKVDGKDKDELAFERYHELFGLKPEHLYATFSHKYVAHRVVGIAPSRSRFPIIAEQVDTGRRFFFPVTVIPRLKPQPKLEVVTNGNS